MLIFDTHDDSYIDELSTYVSIPSVSRDASAPTMQLAAEWLASQLSFADGRVVPTAGHPVVRGEWLGAPGAPTILVYDPSFSTNSRW
jgi:acetylornithine deacetylase/succinyl-diaminopimelate desuccinylase-like protein